MPEFSKKALICPFRRCSIIARNITGIVGAVENKRVSGNKEPHILLWIYRTTLKVDFIFG